MNTLLTPFPTRSFDRLNQMMEELWSQDSFTPTLAPATWNPAVDISETEKQYTFRMDLPGFEQKDIDVELTNDTLTISGKREQIHDEKKDGKLIRYERRYGSFQRSFVLYPDLKAGDIEANFKNGVLTVTVPKIEAAEATKVPVRA